jgi:hypothetical protein
MRVKAVVGLLIAAVVALAVFVVCDDKKSTNPVRFTYPKDYRGTYIAIENWMTVDADTVFDSATFSFKNDAVFYMYSDAESTAGRNLCSVQGTYVFLNDTLTLTITDNNLNQETCVEDAFPLGESEFDHYIDQGYIVFEIRDPALYRKMEMK